MKKIKRIASVAMAAAMLLSAIPMTANAASAKAVESENVAKGIKLSWSKTSSAKNYTVYRSTKKNTGFKSVAKTSKANFIDKKAKAGKTYYYKVKASTGATYKVEKAVRLTTPKLKSVKTNKDDIVTLKWSEVKGAKKYNIYRAKVTSNGKAKAFKLYDTVKKAKYQDWFITTGEYKYKVTAINGDSESADSNVKSLTYVPASYTFATPNEMHTLMNVYFTPVDGVDGYKIYRSINSSDYELVYNVKAKNLNMVKDGTYEGMAVFEDAQVEYGYTYNYAIKTYKGKNTSVLSEGIETEFTEGDVVVEIGDTSNELKDGLQLIEDTLTGILGEELAPMIEMDFSITVEDETIATVDEDFVVTGHAVGKTFATITITASFMGETETVEVPEKLLITVKEADAMLTVGETSNVLIDATDLIKAILGEELAEKVTFTYETEDGTIATVSEDGTITAVAAGKTNVYFIITSTDENGETVTEKSDAFSVYVSETAKDDPAEPTDPSEDATTPSEGTTNPSEGTTNPSEDDITNPSEGATDPSEDDATNPSEGATNPSEDATTQPTSESTSTDTPAEDVTPAE